MGVAPRSTSRGNGGLHSLVPVMKSNNQNGIAVSVIGDQNSKTQAFYVFDGIFPSITNVSNPQDYTYLSTSPTNKMSIFVTFPSAKKIYSILQVPIAAKNFSIGNIDLYAKIEDGSYTLLRKGENSLGITFAETESVQAYKEYRIDCYRGGSTVGCGIAQLQIFGR